MRWMILLGCVLSVLGCKPSIYLQKKSVQLSKPIIEAKQVFFEDATTIHVAPTEVNADLIYQTGDGKERKYEKPLEVDQSTWIRIQAVGGGFIPSDTSYIEVLKLPKNEIISIHSERKLNEKYGTHGLDILIDRKKGGKDFNDGWLGYAGDTITFKLEFDIIEVDKIVVSTLRNHAAWIFGPSRIEIMNKGNEIGELDIKDAEIKQANKNVFSTIDIPDVETRELTIRIIAPGEIPSWHLGKGSKPWLFIDEILIY